MRSGSFRKISLPNTSVSIMDDVLRGVGLDSSSCFVAANLEPDIVHRPGARVTGEQELRFQRAFVELTRERPGLWIDAGSRYSLPTLDHIGLTMLSAPNLKKMLDVVHLGEMEFTFSIFSPMNSSGEVGLKMSLDDVPEDLKHFTVCRDVTLATKAFDHIWGGNFPLWSLAIELPDCYRPLFAFIRAPIRYSANPTTWTWDPQLLQQPLPHANELLYRSYLAKAHENIAQLDTSETIEEAVERLLALSLADLPTLNDIARCLGKSARSLQRHLHSHNMRFQDILSKVRIRAAKDLLRTTARPISDIALAVGYSELSTFNHAFKRATAETAGQYRARVFGNA